MPPHTGSSATNISPTGGKSHRGPLLPRASGLTNLHSAPATPLAIIGLGYVGLPLAVEFGQHRPVIGFNIEPARIAEPGTDGREGLKSLELLIAAYLTARDGRTVSPP